MTRLPRKSWQQKLIDAEAGKPKSKYKNVRVEVDGIRFDSKAEAKRYSQLKLLEKAGEITRLELQKRRTLYSHGDKICSYVADFDYFEPATGTWVTEDVKGVLTQVFKLKAKLFKAQYGREIVLVRNGIVDRRAA